MTEDKLEKLIGQIQKILMDAKGIDLTSGDMNSVLNLDGSRSFKVYDERWCKDSSNVMGQTTYTITISAVEEYPYSDE